MRNKKLVSTVVATALAATMAMPVMAADGGSFDVTVTTKTPVIRVVVPTTMEIAVNQFEMGDAGSQIYSSAFTMENKSEIPVKLNVTSTATPGTGTTLVATKAGATDSTQAGEAWLAVAAQTSDGKYIEENGKTINDLTEESANVATFTENKAEQTYYLNASSGMAYKLLNANESAADIEYAQFYKLTPKTFTASSEDGELKALVKDEDVYYIATASIDDGAALTKIAKGSDTSSLNWANSNTYYTAAQTATAKADIVAADLYLYGDGATNATAGKAAFRYIGKLSGKQESWSATDLTKIGVAYSIVGVQQNTYDDLAGQTGVLTYGLYKAPAPSYTEETAHGNWSGGKLWLAINASTGFSSDDLKVEVSDGGTNYVELASDKYAINDANWVSTTWENITGALGGTVNGKAFIRVTDGTTRYTFENK